MRIVGLPDIHLQLDPLRRLAGVLAAADVIVLPGDLTPFLHKGTAGEAARVLELMPRDRPVLAVPGNWDGPAVQAQLDAAGVNIHRSARVVDGITFLGVGGSPLSNLNTPLEFSESEFDECLDATLAGLAPGAPAVLVCHTPPYKTRVDQLSSGRHVGSEAVLAFIERVQPLVAFTGHIHEARGIDRIGRSWVVNPGPCWLGYYAYAEIEAGEALVEIRAVPEAGRVA